MHPAEHRALRELRVFGTQLESHWEHLGRKLAGTEAALLVAGAAEARLLLAELDALAGARDLPMHPSAAMSGRLTSARPMAPDHLLERNQALRYALLDVRHCVTLLGYAAALAGTRGDAELRTRLAGWQERLERHEHAVHDAVLALGAHPDDAIAPAIPTVPGRIGHRIASGGGALGEWIDRRATARRSS